MSESEKCVTSYKNVDHECDIRELHIIHCPNNKDYPELKFMILVFDKKGFDYIGDNPDRTAKNIVPYFDLVEELGFQPMIKDEVHIFDRSINFTIVDKEYFMKLAEQEMNEPEKQVEDISPFSS